MFKKILIAEDQDTTHLGIEGVLKSEIQFIEKSKYCDDALLKIRASIKAKEPFDVLITDLRFEEDHVKRDLKSGEELVLAARDLIPKLKVIVFSVEKGVARIKRLFDDYDINAFVEKGRDESSHIKKALETIYSNREYCTPQMSRLLRSVDDINELEEKDILLLDLLAKGYTQKYIAATFIPACSISSIEKRLNRLKTLFDASNPVQLISIAKDRGII